MSYRHYVSDFMMEIRNKILQGYTNTQLMRLYKHLTHARIQAIARRTGIVTAYKYKQRELTEEELKKIAFLRRRGYGFANICKKINFAYSRLVKLDKQYNWPFGGICQKCEGEIEDKTKKYKTVCKKCQAKRGRQLINDRYHNDPEYRKQKIKKTNEYLLSHGKWMTVDGKKKYVKFKDMK